ncbi:Uncharacterised protein [Mycobacterium tuberculosis]|nr:Uncharacterised protein [Mycobacterium tuberculosis]
MTFIIVSPFIKIGLYDRINRVFQSVDGFSDGNSVDLGSGSIQVTASTQMLHNGLDIDIAE